MLRDSTLGGVLDLSLVFLGYAYLRFYDQRITELEKEVNATTEPAAAVKRTAEAWRSMAPVLEPSRYPMVLMAEMTQLMPPSGIVIRQFETRGSDIELRGESRDAQLAHQFLEDLQKHRILGRYSWSMPQPSVREKTASFRIQGKLK